MRLVAHVYDSEPWPIFDPETGENDLGVTLDEAFLEVATQTASDAGSDLLEDPGEVARDALRDSIVSDLRRSLLGPGDRYRAPDGVLYTLDEDDR